MTKIKCSIGRCAYHAKTGICELVEIELYQQEGEYCSPDRIICDNYQYQSP